MGPEWVGPLMCVGQSEDGSYCQLAVFRGPPVPQPPQRAPSNPNVYTSPITHPSSLSRPSLTSSTTTNTNSNMTIPTPTSSLSQAFNPVLPHTGHPSSLPNPFAIPFPFLTNSLATHPLPSPQHAHPSNPLSPTPSTHSNPQNKPPFSPSPSPTPHPTTSTNTTTNTSNPLPFPFPFPHPNHLLHRALAPPPLFPLPPLHIPQAQNNRSPTNPSPSLLLNYPFPPSTISPSSMPPSDPHWWPSEQKKLQQVAQMAHAQQQPQSQTQQQTQAQMRGRQAGPWPVQNPHRKGTWTNEDVQKLKEALSMFPLRDKKRIAAHVGTKSEFAVRSYLQRAERREKALKAQNEEASSEGGKGV